MQEAALQDAVIKLCKLLGIWHHHHYDSRRSTPGVPDLLLIGRKDALWRELKRNGRNATAIQSDVGRRMQYIGWDWDVWRPVDLHSGRILRELEGIR